MSKEKPLKSCLYLSRYRIQRKKIRNSSVHDLIEQSVQSVDLGRSIIRDTSRDVFCDRICIELNLFEDIRVDRCIFMERMLVLLFCSCVVIFKKTWQCYR